MLLARQMHRLVLAFILVGLTLPLLGQVDTGTINFRQARCIDRVAGVHLFHDTGRSARFVPHGGRRAVTSV